MKVKELSSLIFSGQRVKIVSCGRAKFWGRANELLLCEYSEEEAKQLYIGVIDKVLCIEITHRETP